MEIGLHLPSAGRTVSAEGIMSVTRDAEKLGFDSVWMFDHLFTPTGLTSLYPYTRDGSYAMSADDPFYDPLALFGVLAGATERLKIGTGVLIGAYRHPIVLAKTLASIERFAPGRLILGLGSGWMKEEFEAVGITRDRRGPRLSEYIRALRLLWGGETVAFDGEFYSWPEAGFLPAPSAPIPIIVGGHSDAALERAAELGDGWAVVTGRGQGSGLDAAEKRLEVLDGFLEKNGRERAGFQLLYQGALWFSDQPHPKMPLTGPPEAIAESLRRLEKMGIGMVDLIVFGTADVISEAATRFAEEVRPLL
jgi:probable F420-dependent oxidoreductase